MAQLDQNEIQEAQMIAARAMAGDDVSSMSAEAEARVDVGDPKAFFCANWPAIRAVLQFIADTVGGVVKMAAKALIAAGNFLYERICNG